MKTSPPAILIVLTDNFFLSKTPPIIAVIVQIKCAYFIKITSNAPKATKKAL